MKMIKKMICKRSGHNFKNTKETENGWGAIMQWKKCERCEHTTFDMNPSSGISTKNDE